MSANLDLVRSILAAWERGEHGQSEWAHPDIEYIVADGPAPGSWRGRAEMAVGARANLDTWEGFRFEGGEYRELDEHRVLVLVRWEARGKASGVELGLGRVRAEGAQVFHIHSGRVTRLIHYWDRERALADLGLHG